MVSFKPDEINACEDPQPPFLDRGLEPVRGVYYEYLLGIFTRPVSNALAGKAIPNNKAVIHSITKYLLLLKACRFLKV